MKVFLVCVGFDSDNRGENTSDVAYNVFGDSIMDGDDFQYSKTVNKIHSVVLPDSVCSIEDNAFAGLYSLRKINCPRELKKLVLVPLNCVQDLQKFNIEKMFRRLVWGLLVIAKNLVKFMCLLTMINIVSRVDLLLIKNKTGSFCYSRKRKKDYDFEWFRIVSEGVFCHLQS